MLWISAYHGGWALELSQGVFNMGQTHSDDTGTAWGGPRRFWLAAFVVISSCCWAAQAHAQHYGPPRTAPPPAPVVRIPVQPPTPSVTLPRRRMIMKSPGRSVEENIEVTPEIPPLEIPPLEADTRFFLDNQNGGQPTDVRLIVDFEDYGSGEWNQIIAVDIVTGESYTRTETRKAFGGKGGKLVSFRRADVLGKWTGAGTTSTPAPTTPTSSVTPPTSSTPAPTPPTSSITPPTSSITPPTSSITPPTSSTPAPTTPTSKVTVAAPPPTSPPAFDDPKLVVLLELLEALIKELEEEAASESPPAPTTPTLEALVELLDALIKELDQEEAASESPPAPTTPTLEALVELLDALIKELDQEEAASESPPAPTTPTLEALSELLDALIKELDQEEAAFESPPASTTPTSSTQHQ